MPHFSAALLLFCLFSLYSDLCAPLESSEAESGASFQPFAARLLGRVLDPSCLLDDLDHTPFPRDDDHDNGGESHGNEEREAEAGAHRNDRAGSRQPGSGEHSSARSDLSADSSASTNANASAQVPSSSPSSSWSFFGSIASVVSSVAQSANLAQLGFGGAAARPVDAHTRVLVMFVPGGITHAEARQLRAMGELWSRRAAAEDEEETAAASEASAAREDGRRGAAPSPSTPRTLLIGSTHVATARELVQQLLHAAAKRVNFERTQ